MTTRSVTLDMARAIGTVGAGLTAGIMLGIPLIVFPGLDNIRGFTDHDRLRVWSKTFDQGLSRMPPIITLSSVSFFLSAYLSTPSPSFPELSASLRFVGGHRRLVLALSGLTLLGTGLWTVVAMAPTNRRLKQQENLADMQPDIMMQGTRGLLQQWLTLHTVRGLIATVAFVGGVVELIAC